MIITGINVWCVARQKNILGINIMQNIDIPFSRETGEMIWSHRSANRSGNTAVWKPNYTFKDSLMYIRTNRYSSNNVTVQSLTDGRKYIISWSTFDELIRRSDIKPGPVFEGTWTFTKRSNYYGVIPV